MRKQMAAEMLGTFCLVFAGTGAIIVDNFSRGAITHVGVAMTFGLIVMTMIYALGDVSGAHFNPAVTIGFWFARRFSLAKVLPYILAQCAGAIAASLVLRLMFPLDKALGATLPVGSSTRSFAFEVILTAILMFVILRVSSGAKEKGITAGIAIGGTVALEALFAGPVCGASMNPARSLAPALVSGNLSQLWIYLVAPVAGALLAVGLARLVYDEETSQLKA